MKLVYFSPVPWHSFSQRPHKFVEWFEKKFDAAVIWIDPYPTRLPVISDYRRLLRQNLSQTGKKEPSWLKVLRPFSLPVEPLPFSEKINRIFWKKIFDEIAEFSDESTYLAIGKPSKMAIMAARMFPKKFALYDGMDDFPAFYAGWSRKSMLKRETWLIKEARFVMTSSSLLQRRWTNVRSDVQLVPNGLDVETIPPPNFNRRKRDIVVFGYVGTVSTWFDWKWIIQLCQLRERDVVRIIGPVLTPPPVFLPNNLELLPALAHEEALRAMQDFDVGLIPFKRTDLTAAVDPIKYYEYRALGIPVLSTNFGEMVYRINEIGTYITREISDISASVEKALTYEAIPAEIDNFKNRSAWTVRFDKASLC